MIHEWSTTAATNTTLEGVSWAENMDPGDVNNGVRALAAAIKAGVAHKGTDIASASSIDLGAATGQFVDVTGTTTITALGTVAAGTTRWVRFTGALTLTHNATSLILPGAANIATANGDIACFASLGSGNWQCMFFSPAAGNARLNAANTFTADVTLKSTDGGSGAGPLLKLFRDSASPAAADTLGEVRWSGNDDGGTETIYARILGRISDPTDSSEDGDILLGTMQAGSLATRMIIANGAYMIGATGSDQGAGTFNATAVYDDGSILCAPIEEALTGAYDPEAWAAIAPHDGLAEYERMKARGFDGSAESFVAEMEARKALPGYWTPEELPERASAAHRHERMMLAMDAQALAIRDLTARVRALEA